MKTNDTSLFLPQYDLNSSYPSHKTIKLSKCRKFAHFFNLDIFRESRKKLKQVFKIGKKKLDDSLDIVLLIKFLRNLKHLNERKLEIEKESLEY